MAEQFEVETKQVFLDLKGVSHPTLDEAVEAIRHQRLRTWAAHIADPNDREFLIKTISMNLEELSEIIPINNYCYVVKD